MVSAEELHALIQTFADNVIAQDNAPSADVGNEHAEQYCGAAAELRLGPAAIDAFARLLDHHDVSVRVSAAACLLKDRTDEAVATLRPIADGKGLAALGAQMTLERYADGNLTIEGINDEE